MKRLIINPGNTINGLVFIKELKPYIMPSRSMRTGLFKCKCGTEFSVIIASVMSGNTSSCGCYGIESRSKRFKKHGLRNHELYGVWSSIKTRCYNKKRSDYKYYGGRGIILSDEFHDFKIWFDYVRQLPMYSSRKKLNLTIDRINNDLNYERNNLRWATKKQQSQNQKRNSGF
jgi:hypothetical protein